VFRRLVCLEVACHHHRHLVLQTYTLKADMRSHLITIRNTRTRTQVLTPNGDSLVKV
jgi:hypothetical protein